MLIGPELYDALPHGMHPWTHLLFAALGLTIFYFAQTKKISPPAFRYFFLLYSLGELGNSFMHFGFVAWGFAHLLQEASMFVGIILILHALIVHVKNKSVSTTKRTRN